LYSVSFLKEAFSLLADDDVSTDDEAPPTPVRNRTYSMNLKNLKAKLPHLVGIEGTPIPYGGDAPRSSIETLLIDESFKGTWLELPVKRNCTMGDWEFHKDKLPSEKPLLNIGPTHSKQGYPDRVIPTEIPLYFTNERVAEFFSSDVKLCEKSKIRLTGTEVFTDDSIPSKGPEPKLIVMERVQRQILRENLAQMTLQRASEKKLKALRRSLRRASPPEINWAEELSTLLNLGYFSSNLAYRAKLLAGTQEMLIKTNLRESVLTRCAGPDASKAACQVSDLGTSTLFGPVNSNLAARVSSNSIDHKEFRLRCLKRPAESSRPPAAKRRAPSYSRPPRNDAPSTYRGTHRRDFPRSGRGSGRKKQRGNPSSRKTGA